MTLELRERAAFFIFFFFSPFFLHDASRSELLNRTLPLKRQGGEVIGIRIIKKKREFATSLRSPSRRLEYYVDD